MFKKILRESIKEVAENHVLVRISFLTGFFHNLFAFAGIGRKINNILHYRYELTLDTFAIGNDIINFFVKNGMARFLFAFGISFFIGYVIFYYLGISWMIFHLHDKGKKIPWGKGFSNYFSVVVTSALMELITFGSRHISLISRLYIMDIFDNILIQIVAGIFVLIIIAGTVVLPFSMYALLLEDHGTDRPEKKARSALGRSTNIVAAHLGTTIKFTLLEIFLKLRFFINLGIVVGVPAGIAYLLVTTNILPHDTAMRIAFGLGGVLLLFIIYVDSIIEAFFLTFRYKLYAFLMGKEA